MLGFCILYCIACAVVGSSLNLIFVKIGIKPHIAASIFLSFIVFISSVIIFSFVEQNIITNSLHKMGFTSYTPSENQKTDFAMPFISAYIFYRSIAGKKQKIDIPIKDDANSDLWMK